MKRLKEAFEGTLGLVIGLIFIVVIIAVVGLVIMGVFEVFRFLGYNFNYVLLVLIAITVFYIFTFDKRDEDKYEISPFILKHKILLTITGLVFMVVIFNFDSHFRVYTDGDYCAYVNVYNPITGGESDYDLYVEVSGGAVSKIYWNNGGWLDGTHFNTNYSVLEGRWGYFEDDRNRKFSVHLETRGSKCSIHDK